MREGVKATTGTSVATKYMRPKVITMLVPMHTIGSSISRRERKISK